jgi:hypothetical protein
MSVARAYLRGAPLWAPLKRRLLELLERPGKTNTLAYLASALVTKKKVS